MDYEKRYKEALGRIQTYVKEGRFSKEFAGLVFPELAESEDEKIRKEIVTALEVNVASNSSTMFPGSHYTVEEAIAWLEKQGEQKPTEWSEEDEKKKEFLIGLVNEWCDKAPNATSMVREEISDWLKSLRPQKQWKPSEEQFNNTSCTHLSKEEVESKV